jgi:1,4-dihydroxy-2-naphthoate polyprenyltransferase
MATAAQWVAGARPRTLPAAIAPVAVGTGAAAGVGAAAWPEALLAAVVALALQVGVNYANDYSDGIRGTDADRVGPFRLVGSGAAAPPSVKRAAFTSLGVGALAGLAVIALSATWPLLIVGVACLLAAWFYTGGRRPYGYRGFGELAVFVFFGLAAVIGTTYLQAHAVTTACVLGGVACGALACALLVANNLRDIPTDALAGKRTLAVLLGDPRSRALFVGLIGLAFAASVAAAASTTPWALLTLLCLPLAVGPARAVRAGASGRDLIAVLAATGRLQLAYGLLLAVGLALT